MATTNEFESMLNEHLDYSLLRTELVDRTWLWKNCQHDSSWKGGTIPIPFQGGAASSVKFGSLTASNDISSSTYVRGELTTQKEMWSTIQFYHRDVIQHDGKVNEDSFLKLLPGELERFTDEIKKKASIQMWHGYADTQVSTDTGTAGGVIKVDHPERFTIGEKVYVDDDNSSVSAACYIRTINMNTGELTLYDARAAGSVVSMVDYSGAQNGKIYYDGTQPGTALGFTSLRELLLSAANGGASTIAGQTKTAYPHLQALNLDGSSITEDNILEALFNKFVTVRNRCSGMPTKCVMSYKNWSAVLKNVDIKKGAYHQDSSSRKSSEYGWDEIEILGPKGKFSLVAVQEMSDTEIYFLDPKTIKFHSNGMIRRHVNPDGNSYFTSRDATAGYSYLVDLFCYGDLMVGTPLANAVIHSVNFALSEE